MRTAKQIWFSAVFALLLSGGTATAQTTTSLKTTAISLKTIDTAKTTPDLMAAANQSKTSNEELLRVQEAEITKAATKLDELRQLVTEGLVARVEFEASERALAKLRSNTEETQKRIADSDQSIREIQAAEAQAKSQAALAPVTSQTRSFLKPTILRYGGQGVGLWLV